MKRTTGEAGIRIAIFFLFLAAALPVFGGEASEVRLSQGQTVYVPLYSHIYSGDREHPFDLTATLSIRNTDINHSITLLSVNYYDSEGKQVSAYLSEPMQVKPLATVRYIIKESDKKGGSGANFLLRWKSEKAVNIPLVESIMIGTKNQQGISFTSRGQAITENN